MKRLKYIAPLAVLLLAMLACSLPWNDNESPAEIIETEPAVEVTVEVETPQEPAFTCPPNMIKSLAFTVNFCYPAPLASGFSQQIVVENPPQENTPPWDVNPNTIELIFSDYILPDTFHQPAIRIYPIEDYIALDPYINDLITQLQGLLESQNPNPDNIPFLPIWGAAQMMRSQVEYINFQNGRGVRFITQYGQAVAPINNKSAFYAFTGITDDGQYLISAVLPISHPLFYPDEMSEPEEGWDAFMNNYETYLTDIVNTINTQPPESFMPALGMLDAMMSTFLIPPEALP